MITDADLPNGSLPPWVPTEEFIRTTNIAAFMEIVGVESYEALHRWSVEHRPEYWAAAIARLGIRFQRPCRAIADFSRGVEHPCWLPDARLNIVDSCFSAPPSSPAILHQAEGGEFKTMSVGELQELTGRVALSIQRQGWKLGDALAIILPMTAQAVAIYLGIIKAGCVAVGIADSFRPKEIASRLRLSNAVGVFTQDAMRRGGKALPLYAKVVGACGPRAIVLGEALGEPLRAGDSGWADFLQAAEPVETAYREPSDPINILFSSGTTGEPKAIPWNQTTPIKCAADAHFHQNIQPGDVLAWPTNLGWMMGPWLIFASLINRAAMALFDGAPTGREFGLFVQRAGVTMLGVVPSLVRGWRLAGPMSGVNWSSIKTLSSTGECSNAEEVSWLMQQAGGKPMIEYCGGTEIGGAYLTGVVTLPCIPGTFNTPALGLDVQILNEHGEAATAGELFIVPPSIGLSTEILNKDHSEIYFAHVPRGARGEVLRRHGDQMERLPDGRWRALGRADDTMNLGGIKVSSAEIEQVLQQIPKVREVAAIAVSPNGGPSLLVIYAVCHEGAAESKEQVATAMQTAIKCDLNPLFKIHDVVLVEALPRTASNKTLRRALRDRYLSEHERA